MAFTALSWNKLDSSTTTVSISIPGGYTDYRLYYSIKGTDASERQLLMRMNNNSSTEYTGRFMYSDGTAIAEILSGTNLNSGTSSISMGSVPGADANKPWLAYEGFLNFFANSLTYRRGFEFAGTYENNVSSGAVKTISGSGLTNLTDSITSIQFFLATGSIAAGSTFALFGATQV
jgi:hypothetical protein